MRRDSLGFFWNDLPPEKAAKTQVARIDRPLPPIPKTGWKAPNEFPRLEKARVIGIDTETKDLELNKKGPGVRRGAHIVGLSIATEDRSWYFPMRHEIGGENLDPESVMRWAKDELTRPGQMKVGANLLYDLDFLEQEGVKVAGPFWDVLNAEALIDENRRSYSLDAIGHTHIGQGKADAALVQWITDAYNNKEKFRADIYRSPASLVGFYAEQDAALPIKIMRQQEVALEGDNLLDLNDMEQGLIPLLLGMRRRGVPVDLAKTQALELRLLSEIGIAQARLNTLAGCEVVVTAAESIAKAFDRLGIPYPRTAKKNKPSFTKEWLEHHPSPIAHEITRVRTLRKFLDTFIRGYILDLNVAGRIHALFNQLPGDEFGTVSGRFSSSLPNLQNIPIRDPIWGPLIRALYCPEDGEDWAKLDWSQIEFRLVTHYGRGPSAEAAREAYRSDPTTDFHLMVAKMVWPEAAREMRGPAKNINFGLVYGMGEGTLAEHAGIPIEEAVPIFEQYHAALPFIKDLYQEAQRAASGKGYIRTLLNRRRRFHLWEPRYWDQVDGDIVVTSAQPFERATKLWGTNIRRAFTHKALNALIQGSAADLMKKAMRLYLESGAVKVLGVPLLTVHDELCFSVPRTPEGHEALMETKHLMETCVELKVPVIADLQIGPNWGETK